MKSYISAFVICLFLLTTSCREEEFISIGTQPDRALTPESTITRLLYNVTLKDGSMDNLIDGASCISLILPVTVMIEGELFTVGNLEEDLEIIADRLDEVEDDDNDDDDDEDNNNDVGTVITILFPITIISPNHTEMQIATSEELKVFQDSCSEENAIDNDIECLDVLYPVQLSIFDVTREVLETRTVPNDASFNLFLAEINEDSQVTLNFPISVVLSDMTEIALEDIPSLEEVFISYGDSCDEKDTNEPRTQDCGSCAPDDFFSVWAVCSLWEAHKFKLDGDNVKEDYKDHTFEFFSNGEVNIDNGSEVVIGTWIANGSDEDITLTFNFPGMEDFNAAWNLKEVKEKGTKMDVRLFMGDDELHIQSLCD